MDDLLAEKKEVCDLAKALIDNDDFYLDRIIRLNQLGHTFYREVCNTEFHIFIVIESDTDHLPTHSVREYCSDAWLAKVDQEIMRKIEFYKDEVTKACNTILSKYGNV